MNAQNAMPERIGRFHIRSMLGRGAMGIVYLGHDEEIDRLVAIKLIRADLLDTEERESYLKRFRNEAKIAGRCMHANIVGLYDFAMHDENPYLVMEYIDGIGLQQFFPRGSRRPVHEVIHIALQVLDALHYAHGRSIVHRDIKPANILMMPDYSLKITDFGISRLTSMELTVTPLLIGTPSYMSPEQCLGSALDGRNDLFSLGCVLYELTAGERAFAGVNYTETIFSIVNKPHVPLSRLRDDLPPGFSDAIDRALAKAPDQRHPDAASFARVLDEIAREARLPRSGMPPVIVDSARMTRGPSPATGRDGGAAMASGSGPAAEAPLVPPLEAPPTISLPMTQAVVETEPPPSPVPPIDMAAPAPSPVPDADDEDPDATLMRTLRPRPVMAVGEQPVERPIRPPAEETPRYRPDIVRNDARTMLHAVDDAPSILVDPVPVATHPVASPFTPVAAAEPAPETRPAPVADPTEAGTVSFTPGPHFSLPVPVGEAERARIVDCLAVVLGPIAPLLARRAEQPGMSADALAAALAGLVRQPNERQLFRSLLEGRPEYRLAGLPAASEARR